MAPRSAAGAAEAGRGDVGRRPAPASSLSPITGRARAAREIVASLQADIATGRLPRGARLPGEPDLARHFGVSQPTVREAVRALDLMGLLDVRHGSGVYVTGDVAGFLDASLRVLLQVEQVGIVEVLDVRTLLGGYSARQAAEHVTPDEVAGMTAYLDACDNPPDGAAPRDMVIPAAAFQLAVSAAARNPLLFAIESFLVKLIIQLQLTALEHHGGAFWRERIASFGTDRRRLLGFIAARDGDGAASAMNMYLRTQFAQFAADPELAAVSLRNPFDAARQLDALFPDLRPR